MIPAFIGFSDRLYSAIVAVSGHLDYTTIHGLTFKGICFSAL